MNIVYAVSIRAPDEQNHLQRAAWNAQELNADVRSNGSLVPSRWRTKAASPSVPVSFGAGPGGGGTALPSNRRAFTGSHCSLERTAEVYRSWNHVIL